VRSSRLQATTKPVESKMGKEQGMKKDDMGGFRGGGGGGGAVVEAVTEGV